MQAQHMTVQPKSNKKEETTIKEAKGGRKQESK